MADTAVPKLKRLVLPSTVDVSSGSATMAVSVEADDEGGSGIRSVTVHLNNALGFSHGAFANFSIPGLFPGAGADTFLDATPNTAAAQLALTRMTAPGNYTVRQVWVEDMAGNTAIYSTQQLQALGIKTAFSVTGGIADSTAPTLRTLDLPATIDIGTATKDVVVTATANDNIGGTGVDRMVVYLDQKLGFTHGAFANFSIPGLFGSDTFRDATPGSASSTLSLTNLTAPGTYNISQVLLYDLAGNVAIYHTPQLEALGIRTSMTVTGGTTDSVAPSLQKLVLPEAVDLSKGTSDMHVTVQATDNAGGSGVDSVTVYLDGKLGYTYGAFANFSIGDSETDNFRDATPASASKNITLTTLTAPGTYNVTQVWVNDRAGNTAIYSADQLAGLGIRTSFRVSDGGPAPAAPASALSTFKDGALTHSISSSAWPASGSVPFSLTLTYDAAAASFGSAEVAGVSGSFQSSSVSEVDGVGTLRISGTAISNGKGAVSIDVKLVSKAGATAFTFEVKSFTVAEKVQAFDGASTGILQYGSSGADTIIAAQRASLIDAGDGLDTVTFALNAASYQIVKASGGASITDSAGRVTQLQHVERLQFADKAIALDTDGIGGQVYRLYQAAFDRKPDAAGIGYWMRQIDTGSGLEATARAFIGSKEFSDLFGANLSNAAFIRALYDNVLHREPEKAGLDFWINAVDSGLDRASTLLAFSDSAENIAQVTGSITNGFEYTPWH